MNIRKAALVTGVLLFIAGMGALAWFWIKDTANYTYYKNSTEGISMKYPRGWKRIDSPKEGAIVVFVSPKKNAMDLFQENWNISTTSLAAEPMSLEQYAQAAQKQMKFAFQGIESAAVLMRLAKHPGYKLVFRSRADDGLVMVTYVFIYRDVAYNITYVNINSGFDDPREQERIADVIGSLKVLF